MSTRKSTSSSGGVVVQKPRSDVYTMMLIVSFIALLIACILLFLELSRYGDFPQWSGGTFAVLQYDAPGGGGQFTALVDGPHVDGPCVRLARGGQA